MTEVRKRMPPSLPLPAEMQAVNSFKILNSLFAGHHKVALASIGSKCMRWHSKISKAQLGLSSRLAR